MAIVLENFLYSTNGYTVIKLQTGDEYDFAGDTQAIVDSGRIEADGFKPTPKKKEK